MGQNPPGVVGPHRYDPTGASGIVIAAEATPSAMGMLKRRGVGMSGAVTFGDQSGDRRRRDVGADHQGPTTWIGVD